MPHLLPIILVALGGAGFVLMRDARVVFASLLVQWLGLVWATAVMGVSSSGVFGFNAGSEVELITALTCVAVLALRPRVKGFGDSGDSPAAALVASTSAGSTRAGHSSLDAPHATGYLLAGAAVLLAGLGGMALALILPLAEGGEA